MLLMDGWTVGAKSEMTIQYLDAARMKDPLLLLIMSAAGVYFAKLWIEDRRAARDGRPNPHALPGATPATARAVAIAVSGALVLLVLETFAEHALGVSAEQSRMTWLMALHAILGASVIEELIFRGWLVIDHRGRTVAWAGAVAASVLFALLHPFLWRWEAEGFQLTLGAKGCLSTGAVFATSLWLYAARLAKWNPHQSLLPCVAAHAAKNLGVVAIKAALGFMGPAW
jgi:membrane protease YdiL (CAAX protease family)